MKTTIQKIIKDMIPIIEEELHENKSDKQLCINIMNRMKLNLPKYINMNLHFSKTHPYIYNFYIDLRQCDKYSNICEQYQNTYPFFQMADSFLKQFFLSIKVDWDDNVHSQVYDKMRIFRLFSGDRSPEIYEELPLFDDTDLEEIYTYMCSFEHHLLNDLIAFGDGDIQYEISVSSSHNETRNYSFKASHHAKIDYMMEVYIEKFIDSPHQHVFGNGIAKFINKKNIVKTMEFVY